MSTAIILATIDRKRPQIMEIIPKTFRAALHWESIRQGIGLAVSRSPKLQECDPTTVYTSVLDILRFGLDPSGGTGQAYLVPFFNSRTRRQECQAIIGQQGKIEMAFRTGKYASIVTEVVHENDTYSFDLARRHLTHTYDPSQPRGQMLFAYCRIWLTSAPADGPPSFQEIMGYEDFEKISRGKKSPAYKEWYGEMWRRSVLSRCLKRAPKSIDLAEVLSRESEMASQQASGIIVDSTWEEPAAEVVEPPALPEPPMEVPEEKPKTRAEVKRAPAKASSASDMP